MAACTRTLEAYVRRARNAMTVRVTKTSAVMQKIATICASYAMFFESGWGWLKACQGRGRAQLGQAAGVGSEKD